MTAVALRPAPRTAPRPLPRPALAAVRDDLPAQGALALDFGHRTLAPAARPATLPPPGPTAHAVVVGVIEVLDGRRSPLTLQRTVRRDVLASVARRAAARRGRAGSHRQPVLRRLRVTQPSPGCCEVAAVVVIDDRVRALALRLRAVDGRWLADALELG